MPICYLRMILSKNGILVGYGYATNDMFKLNVINKDVSSYAYIVDSFICGMLDIDI